jgi:flagellar assembly protein FliH
MERAMAEAEQIRAKIQSVMSELASFREALYKRAGGQLQELAFAIAEQIVAARAAREEEVVLETINRCISEILDAGKIKVRVNPNQRQFVQDSIDLIKEQNDSVNQIVIEADSRVSPGGCVIETDSGSADGRLSSQLATLKRELESLES